MSQTQLSFIKVRYVKALTYQGPQFCGSVDEINLAYQGGEELKVLFRVNETGWRFRDQVANTDPKK